MSKLGLIAKAILADAKNPEIPDDKKMETIEEGMKVFAVELINLFNYLKEKGVDTEISVGVIETMGVQYDGRAKKFK